MLLTQEYICQRPFNGTICRYYIYHNTIYYHGRCVGLEPLRHASGQGVISSTIAYIPTHPWRRLCRLYGALAALTSVRDTVSFFHELLSLERLGAYISAVALCTKITSLSFILSQSKKYWILMCLDLSDVVGPPVDIQYFLYTYYHIITCYYIISW